MCDKQTDNVPDPVDTYPVNTYLVDLYKRVVSGEKLTDEDINYLIDLYERVFSGEKLDTSITDEQYGELFDKADQMYDYVTKYIASLPRKDWETPPENAMDAWN